jgi:hypothetical protein
VGYVDGALTGFAPAVNGVVRSILVHGGRIYIGGDFGIIGTTVRNNLAAFSASTGALDAAWRPAVNGKVTALRLSPDFARLYVAGRFTSLAGSTSAAYLGAVSPTTGALVTTFLPRPGWPVESLTVDSRGVHVGGGGSAGGHVAAYSPAGAALINRITVDGDVQALALDGDTVYVGGHFTNLCVGGTGGGAPFRCTLPTERRKALAVAVSTGSVTSWSPSLNSPLGAWSAAVDPSTHHVWVGGDFTTVNGQSVQHLAVFR